MDKKIRLAFAVNRRGMFEKRHFGDADKFLIYEMKERTVHLVEEVDNQDKLLFTDNKHGDPEKGKAIISFLNQNKVDVLVSQQFGRNIKMIIQHFVPVLITKETPEEVANILLRHIKWLEDELTDHKNNYRPLQLYQGILKHTIDNKHHK